MVIEGSGDVMIYNIPKLDPKARRYDAMTASLTLKPLLPKRTYYNEDKVQIRFAEYICVQNRKQLLLYQIKDIHSGIDLAIPKKLPIKTGSIDIRDLSSWHLQREDVNIDFVAGDEEHVLLHRDSHVYVFEVDTSGEFLSKGLHSDQKQKVFTNFLTEGDFKVKTRQICASAGRFLFLTNCDFPQLHILDYVPPHLH